MYVHFITFVIIYVLKHQAHPTTTILSLLPFPSPSSPYLPSSLPLSLPLSFPSTSLFFPHTKLCLGFCQSFKFSESLETELHIQLSRHTHRVRFCSHSFFALPFPPWSLSLNSTAKENLSLSFSQNSAYHNWRVFLKHTQQRPNPSKIPPPTTLH